MPTYEYRCRDCDHELEAQQSFHDDPLTTCPECGGSLRKKFSAVGISFKGSGFYKTDSRSSGGSGSGGGSKESGNGSSSDSGSSGSGESSSSSSGSSSSGSAKESSSSSSSSSKPKATTGS